MLHCMDFLRQMNIVSIVFRLILAMTAGGLLGIERARKGRAAGFRTYMLVCVGASLTFMLAQYNVELISARWSDLAQVIGVKTDVSRFSAQVINGIGFLGAGTIIVSGNQRVKGLTTAAGLWASGCMGIAIGAGFYECVIVAFVLIFLCMRVFSPIEHAFVEKATYLSVFVEFETLDNLGEVIGCIRGHGAQILDVDLNRGREKKNVKPNAIFSINLMKRQAHTGIIAAISELESVTMVEEI